MFNFFHAKDLCLGILRIFGCQGITYPRENIIPFVTGSAGAHETRIKRRWHLDICEVNMNKLRRCILITGFQIVSHFAREESHNMDPTRSFLPTIAWNRPTVFVSFQNFRLLTVPRASHGQPMAHHEQPMGSPMASNGHPADSPWHPTDSSWAAQWHPTAIPRAGDGHPVTYITVIMREMAPGANGF